MEISPVDLRGPPWNPAMRTTTTAILGIAIVTLSAQAGPVNAQNYPWCAQRGESTNCGFVSYEQCMASSRWCNRNPLYQPPTEQPRSRGAARRRHG